VECLSCICYLAVLGICSFVLGRALPKGWFHGDRFPFCSFPFERDGKIYEKLNIKKWQKKVPDMSRILPKAMPPKRMGADYAVRLPRMVQETCVAEVIHVLLCVFALVCLDIWPGAGGVIITSVYILANLPFILIQRYNRPKLMRVMAKCGRVMKGAAVEGVVEGTCGL
jgi:glycosyl-4,4'-diaponeurosporenoate acyltransferase